MSRDRTSPFAIYMVWGPNPENTDETMMLEVFGEESEAESYLMRGLFLVAQDHVRSLKKGGTCSLLVTRGRPPKDDDPGARMNGSFVINNPGGERHAWEFSVDRRIAQPVKETL